MRNLLLVLVILGASIHSRAADSPAPSTDFSGFKTPEEYFKYVQTQLQKGPSNDMNEFAMRLQRASDAMGSLVERFPQSPEVWQARVMKVQFALMASQIAQRPAPANAVEEINGVLKAQDAPKSAKQSARMLLIQLHAIAGPLTDFEKQVDLYEKEYPDQPLPSQLKLLLAKQLQPTNPDKAKKIEAEAGKDRAAQEARQAAAEAKKNELLNKPLAIKFTAVDGREVDLAGMQGKVVLVDFWATWCGPCMQEVPEVVDIYKKYHDKGFEIVGISLDQDKEKLLEVTKAEGMTWPQYFDGKGWKNDISTRFGITSIPQMWLVDKKGNLVSLKARQDLEGQVQKLLAE